MSAHHPRANRGPDSESEQHTDQSSARRQVSTRVLLDAGTPPTCDACGDTIALKARHKCLTVRDGDCVREFTFCDEACLAAKRD